MSSQACSYEILYFNIKLKMTINFHAFYSTNSTNKMKADRSAGILDIEEGKDKKEHENLHSIISSSCFLFPYVYCYIFLAYPHYAASNEQTCFP